MTEIEQRDGDVVPYVGLVRGFTQQALDAARVQAHIDGWQAGYEVGHAQAMSESRDSKRQFAIRYDRRQSVRFRAWQRAFVIRCVIVAASLGTLVAVPLLLTGSAS